MPSRAFSLSVVFVALATQTPNAGLAAARVRGRKGGRRIAHSDKKIATAQKLADTSNDTIAQICESLGISRSTYYRRLHKN